MSTLIPEEAERRNFGSLWQDDIGAHAWYDEPDTDIVSGRINEIYLHGFCGILQYVSVRLDGALGGLPAMNPDDELWVLRRPATFAPPSILDRVPFNDAVKVA